MKPPPGVKIPDGHALRLIKSLYGTRQAARCWWKFLKGVLFDLGYTASLYDSSLYVLRGPAKKGIIWIHVDDGVITALSTQLLRQLEVDLRGRLEIKWEHNLTSVVGINIARTTEGFSLHQEKLLRTIAMRFWDGVSSASTPLPSSFKPVADPDG